MHFFKITASPTGTASLPSSSVIKFAPECGKVSKAHFSRCMNLLSIRHREIIVFVNCFLICPNITRKFASKTEAALLLFIVFAYSKRDEFVSAELVELTGVTKSPESS